MNNQHAQVFMLVPNHQWFRTTQCLDLIKLLKTDVQKFPERELASKKQVSQRAEAKVSPKYKINFHAS